MTLVKSQIQFIRALEATQLILYFFLLTVFVVSGPGFVLRSCYRRASLSVNIAIH